MKTLSFNSLKPLAFTALLIVFAASFNTAEAESYGCPHGTAPCKGINARCDYNHDCYSLCCPCFLGICSCVIGEGDDCK